MTAVSAIDARRCFFSLHGRVDLRQTTVEIVSTKGNVVLPGYDAGTRLGIRGGR